MKKKWYLIAFVMCLGLSIFSGCGNGQAEYELKIENKAEADNNVTSEGDTMALKVSEIAKGNIYEITENNFQEGLDYYFTEEELAEIMGMLKDESLEMTEGIPKKEDIAYVVIFYDAAGMEVLSFTIDRANKIYEGSGYCVKNEQLTMFFKKYTQK